jgi:hypothetical protein
MAVTKKIENFYKKEVFRETWSEAKSPQQANWTPTCQPQVHKPNPYSVEEEEESMDGMFQESNFIDEKFEHEGVEDEDPSQGLIDWDTPPIYDDDVNEEEPIEEPLESNPEEKYEEYGLHHMFSGLYPNADDQLEDEEPTDDITDYEEDDIADDDDVDEDFSGEVPNFNGEDVDYVDFLGVEDILNSPNVGEFYADEKNYIFTRETMAHPFLSIFMACKRENEREKYGKVKYLPNDVQGFNYKHRGMPMMKCIAFIVVCCFVLTLRNGKRNELIGHPKDHGKN